MLTIDRHPLDGSSRLSRWYGDEQNRAQLLRAARRSAAQRQRAEAVHLHRPQELCGTRCELVMPCGQAVQIAVSIGHPEHFLTPRPSYPWQTFSP